MAMRMRKVWMPLAGERSSAPSSDVAYLDRRLRVLAVRTMPPGRLGLPRVRARHVIESEAGAMAEWGVRSGVRVTVVTGSPGTGTGGGRTASGTPRA